jgi:hypothetical protein
VSATEALPAVAVSPVGAAGTLLAPEELELDEDELEELEELEEEDEPVPLELPPDELDDEELELEDELDDEEPPEPIWTTASVLVMVPT